MKRQPLADDYFQSAERWQDELRQLRGTLLSTELEETLKWGAPCYTYRGKNVVGMGAFKSYFGLWFFQGALLADKARVLINANEGKTKALRQWRMESRADINEALIRAYVNEAIQLQSQGGKIKADRGKPVLIPSLLRAALANDSKAAAAFEALGRGKQREYADYLNDAKREATKLRRLETILPKIRDGAGLNDKYRSR